MNSEKCNNDVFENGETIGVFTCTKEEAESICAYITKATECPCDWHYVGGRVVMKIIPVIKFGLSDAGTFTLDLDKYNSVYFDQKQNYDNMFLNIRYNLLHKVGFTSTLSIDDYHDGKYIFLFKINQR